MARGRMLNKTISIDQSLNSLTDREALIFTWLIPHLNKNGCFYGDEKVIKSLVFPLKTSITPTKIRAALHKIAQKTLIDFYKTRGVLYISFPGFDKNQPGLRKEREGDSDIPEPENGDLLPQNVGVVTANCGSSADILSPEVKGVRLRLIPTVEGEGVKGIPPPASPLTEKETEFFAVYEKYLGTIPSIIVPELRLAAGIYPLDWVKDAFIETVEHAEKPCWRYAHNTLIRWTSDGRDVAKKKQPSDNDPNEFERRYGHIRKESYVKS